MLLGPWLNTRSKMLKLFLKPWFGEKTWMYSFTMNLSSKFFSAMSLRSISVLYFSLNVFVKLDLALISNHSYTSLIHSILKTESLLHLHKIQKKVKTYMLIELISNDLFAIENHFQLMCFLM